MAGDIHGVTHLSNLSVQVAVSADTASLGTVTVSGKQTFGSGSTVVFANAHVSQRTTALASLASVAPSNADNGVWGFTFLASGMSLCYRSGNTIYVFNSAGSMAAP